MKKHVGWSYAPYKPILYEFGDIYICRLVPSSTAIHMEWLALDGADSYSIYIRVRDCGEFRKAGETGDLFFDITGLEPALDYEFYVESNGKKSRVRLARTGEAVGVVVNYLHPDDRYYGFSGHCLCSPSLVRHPDGFLLSSMDVFEHGGGQCLTLIFRSDDDGETWHYVSELYPAFWGKMFIHKGELYMTACSTEYADLLIGKSTDGGKTWTEPTILLRGLHTKNYTSGVHKNPEPMVYYGGRIWGTIEWGHGAKTHPVMVMSAPEDSDLLDASSWSFSEPLEYNPNWEGVAKGPSDGNIEGSLVVLDGELYNIMRYGVGPQNDPPYGLILGFKVDTENPENPLQYWRAIKFPGNRSKFTIKFDEVTGKFFTICTRITDPYITARNLLTLMVSDDCIHWSVLKDIYDRRDMDPMKVGFQYVDYEFEGDDILFLCRTGLNEPDNYHNTNYQTFDRIKNFRQILADAGELEIFDL